MSGTPAGWYPTPDGRQRYWDGNQWTEHFAEGYAAGQARPDEARPGSARVGAAGTEMGIASGGSKPLYRKKRFLIPAALVGIIVAATSLSGGSEDEPDAPAAMTASPTTSATGPAKAASASPASSTPAPTTPAPTTPPPAPSPEPAAPNPYDEAYGTFKAISKKGRGDAVVPLPKGVSAAVVTMTHKGSSNFSVNALDASNQSTGDLLANEIGSYKGAAAYGLLDMGSEQTKLQVSADGSWTLLLQPISAMKLLGSTTSGKGSAVFRYEGDPADWTISHNGTSNFAVRQTGGGFPNLAVNEIGKYSGTVPMDEGPSVIEITADGAWTFKKG